MRASTLLVLSVVFCGSSLHADEPKQDAADKAIAQAVAELKAELDKAKDDAEKRKLSAAVSRLESLLKKPAKDDNDKLVDFVDAPRKHQKQAYTFRVRTPISATTPMNEWGDTNIEFTGTVGSTEVLLKVYCPQQVLLKAPAVVAGGEVLVTIIYDENKRTKPVLVVAKRP
jgi:hypothetical protein